MSLNTNVFSQVSRNLEKYEGRVPHLYGDSAGNVTVGVGHLVSPRQSVTTLNLSKRGAPGGLASAAEKLADYDAVAGHARLNPLSHNAAYYKQFTALDMNDPAITALRNADVASFYTELTRIYSVANGSNAPFDNYPENVQIALFDMIFNLGATKLATVFTSFNSAIIKGNWHLAALQSHRRGIPAARNSYVNQLLMSAASVTVASPALN